MPADSFYAWEHVHTKHGREFTDSMLVRTDDFDLLRLLMKDPQHYFYLYSNPNLPEDIMLEGSKSENVKIRTQVARHPKLPPQISYALAEDPHYLVRLALAESSPDPDLLEMLVYDESSKVLAGLVRNKYTPSSVLYIIGYYIEDQPLLIRSSYAKNSNAPVDILNRLVHDESPSVITNLTYNTAPISDAQKIIIQNYRSSQMRERIARSTTDPEVLSLIWYVTKSERVREVVRRNPASEGLDLH
jgi:hypothetical protein